MDANQRARRRFLGRLGGLGLALGSGALLGRGALAQDAAPAGCDTAGLTDQQKQTRQSLQYTDQSQKADQFCHNCQYFTPASGQGCGSCSVVPGPIHPQGWCMAWVQAG